MMLSICPSSIIDSLLLFWYCSSHNCNRNSCRSFSLFKAIVKSVCNRLLEQKNYDNYCCRNSMKSDDYMRSHTKKSHEQMSKPKQIMKQRGSVQQLLQTQSWRRETLMESNRENSNWKTRQFQSTPRII